jgi:outer membrane protein TolC
MSEFRNIRLLILAILTSVNIHVAQTVSEQSSNETDRVVVTADRKLNLSLQDAIARALQNNSDILVARDEVKIAENSLTAFEGYYDPVLTFSNEVRNSVTPTTNVFSGSNSSGTLNQTSIDLNTSVVKPIKQGGANLELFFNNSRQKSSSAFEQLNPHTAASLGVQLTQPLLRDRSIDAPRRNILIQQKRAAQSDIEFRRVTTETIAQVEAAYWDLVFAKRNEQNRNENLDRAKENLRLTQARITAGAAAPLELAEVQTQIANLEAELLSATQNVTTSENRLKSLLFSDPNNEEWQAVLEPTDRPDFNLSGIDLAAAIKKARENRPELTRLRMEQEINEIDTKFYKNQTKPRVDLHVSVATTGLAGQPSTALRPGQNFDSRGIPENLSGGYGQTWKNLFSLNSRTIAGGVTIELPFRNRTAEANLANAEIRRNQIETTSRAQVQSIDVEVRNATQSVETARQKITSAKKATENALAQLEGERKLYQVGRSTTFLLLERENQLSTARTQELSAEIDYNKALSELQRATAGTLSSHNITIHQP